MSDELEARRYLMKYRESMAYIESLTDEAERLSSVILSLSATMSDTGGSGSGPSDTMGDSIARLLDLTERINTEVDIYIRTRDEVRRVIRRVFEVNPVYGQDLHYRYIDCKSPFATANDMGFTTRHERRAHKEALAIAARFM